MRTCHDLPEVLCLGLVVRASAWARASLTVTGEVHSTSCQLEVGFVAVSSTYFFCPVQELLDQTFQDLGILYYTTLYYIISYIIYSLDYIC